MIQITPQMRILLAVEPTDFRKGIDGLAQVCRQHLGADPFGGAVFVFISKRRTSLRLLVYDSQGFWLAQKRLSTGRFRWWPAKGEDKAVTLDAHQLQLLLWNGDPTQAHVSPPWRRLAVAG